MAALVLSIGEVGPCWNYYNVNGGTTYIQTMWNLYMPMLMDSDATGSKFTPNPNYVESFEVDDSTGKQVVKITMNPDAVFNDGTPIDYRAFETVEVLLRRERRLRLRLHRWLQPG